MPLAKLIVLTIRNPWPRHWNKEFSPSLLLLLLLSAFGYIACSSVYSKCIVWNSGVGSSYCAHPSFLAVLIPDLQLHWTTRMPSLEMKKPWLHMGLFLGTWYVWFLKMTCRHLTYLHLQIQNLPHSRILTNLLWLPAHVRLASPMNSGATLPMHRPPSLMPGMMTVRWVLKVKRWNSNWSDILTLQRNPTPIRMISISKLMTVPLPNIFFATAKYLDWFYANILTRMVL